MENKHTSNRLIGLDWIRLILVGPIAMMHVWNIFYGEPDVTQVVPDSNYQSYVKYIGSSLGYAGIYIFVLSFFLYGFLNRSNLVRGKKAILRILLLFLAMCSTQFNPYVPLDAPNVFIWDIFSFVLLSFFLVSALSYVGEKVWNWIGIGAAAFLTLSPLWVYLTFNEKLLPVFAQILIPQTSDMGPNGWFLIPWVGLPLLAFSFGRFCSGDESSQKWKWLLGIFAGAAVVAAIYAKQTVIIPLKMTSEYYAFSFRQAPSIFWLYFLPFLLALYAFSRPAVNAWLERTPLRFVRQLQWSKNFWFAYVVHFGVIDFLSVQQEFFSSHLFFLNWLWLFVVIGVELLLQAFFVMLKFYAWAGKKVLSKVTPSA